MGSFNLKKDPVCDMLNTSRRLEVSLHTSVEVHVFPNDSLDNLEVLFVYDTIYFTNNWLRSIILLLTPYINFPVVLCRLC